MTREMQDGINSDAAGMDHSIDLVAYYIDGPFAWTPAEIGLFPHSVHVRIATRWTTRDGNVIDRENGDATPEQAAAWAHQRRADGYAWPTVYSSISNQAGVITAFNAVGEPMPLWWLAHYDSLDVLPVGAIAKQYADPGPLDRSIVADYWPGVDGGDMAIDFTQPLPDPASVAGTNTVGEALTVMMGGIGGRRTAGAGAIGLAQIDTDVKAVSSAITAEETALLAAIKTAGGAPTDPTAVAAALEAAGLPAAIVGALLALLAKAAPPTPGGAA